MPDLNQQEIGARIREVRGAMTQKDFADKLGVGRTSVVRYEAGERMPDAVFIAKANLVMGIDPIWLLTGQRGAPAQAPPLAPDEAALLDNYRHSPPEGQAALKTTSAALAQCPAKARQRAA